jgi:hypothetical protein
MRSWGVVNKLFIVIFLALLSGAAYGLPAPDSGDVDGDGGHGRDDWPQAQS